MTTSPDVHQRTRVRAARMVQEKLYKIQEANDKLTREVNEMYVANINESFLEAIMAEYVDDTFAEAVIHAMPTNWNGPLW